ncbi:MAG TPA: CopD family protein [Kofleriaceae bacterium]|nr:CopD family protein [Kofleriaceae bacterium]
MSASTYLLVLSAHFIGLFFWIAGLVSVYWLLRLHAHAPKDAHEKLTLMERSLAMLMDIAALLAIGCGVALAVSGPAGSAVSWFKIGKWLHYKLVLVLVLLAVHGMVRARIKKFGRGEISTIPQWIWSLLLIAVAAIILIATTKLQSFQ